VTESGGDPGPISVPALAPADAELVERARSVMRRRFRPGYHHVAAALRTTTGQVFEGIHLEATVGRIAVCAEAIALGSAALAGDTDVDLIVAVDRNGNVVSPCGMCREMLLDFAPRARVIIPETGGETIVAAEALLPSKYRRRHD
jgi:cytidine deaminase